MMETAEQSNHCLNCGTALKGNFCHYCGQEKIKHREGFLHTMFHFLGDFIHFDSMIFGTMLPLLFKPGYLVKQFEAGRRVSYLNPIKMYVFLSFVFFTVFFIFEKQQVTHQQPTQNNISEEAIKDSVLKNLQYASDEAVNFDFGEINFSVESYEQSQMKLDETKRDGIVMHSLKKKFFELMQEKDKAALTKRISESFLHNLPKVLFVLLPFFALILKILYIRKKYYYVSHLIFTIQYFNFIFLGSAIVLLCMMNQYLSFIGNWWILLVMVYLWIALKKVYEQNAVKTTFKFIILNILSFILIASGAILNTIYAVYNT